MGLFSRSRNPAEQRLWDQVYGISIAEYTDIDGYDQYDARRSANAAVRGWYSSGGQLRTMTPLRRCPDPGDVLNIGTFMGVDSVRRNGELIQDEFAFHDNVALLWSHDLQACLVFPHLPDSVCDMLPTPREDRIARVWAKGRGAKCSRKAQFPAPAMPIVRPGIAIAYDSDKFTHGRRQGYVHHFGPGVRCYTARDLHGAPQAIMVRGGKLRLTTHGLAG